MAKYEDEDQPLPLWDFMMGRSGMIRLESVSLVMEPLHPSWTVTKIGTATENSKQEWVCVQEDCDGVHHYYVKQEIAKVAL